MLTKEQISKAAQWWATVIQNPKFDNGDSSNTGFMANMLATIASERTDPQGDSVKAFETAVEEALIKANEDGQLRYVGCDYHPDRLLAECAAKAGVDEMRFPWKTHMYFHDDKIEVSYGYRAPIEVIA